MSCGWKAAIALRRAGRRSRRARWTAGSFLQQFRSCRCAGRVGSSAKAQVLGEGDELVQHRAQFGEERGEVLGRRLRRVDQRFDVVEGGAQVDEGRVRLPHHRRQLFERPFQRHVLAADRLEGVVGVGDRARQLRPAAGDRAGQVAGADQELGEQLFVGVQFGGEGGRPVQRRAEVLVAFVRFLAAPGVDLRRCP